MDGKGTVAKGEHPASCQAGNMKNEKRVKFRDFCIQRGHRSVYFKVESLSRPLATDELPPAGPPGSVLRLAFLAMPPTEEGCPSPKKSGDRTQCGCLVFRLPRGRNVPKDVHV